MADVEIKGMRELYIALSTKLPRNMEGRLLQKALAAGTAPLVKQARSNIRGQVAEDFVGPPVPYPRSRTGTLKRAIYASRGKTSTPEKEVRIVSVRRGGRAAKRGLDAYYARWVEYGHRVGRKGKRLSRTSDVAPSGRVMPKPFMRPAWDTTQRQSLDRITDGLRVQLERAIAASRF